MTGTRKMHGFYVTTLLFFVALVLTLIMSIKGGWMLEPTKLVETYFWAQTIITAGFFGFNGLEHWANRGGK